MNKDSSACTRVERHNISVHARGRVGFGLRQFRSVHGMRRIVVTAENETLLVYEQIGSSVYPARKRTTISRYHPMVAVPSWHLLRGIERPYSPEL